MLEDLADMRRVARYSSPGSLCFAVPRLLHAQPTHDPDHRLRVPARPWTQRLDLAPVEFCRNGTCAHVSTVADNVQRDRFHSLRSAISFCLVQARLLVLTPELNATRLGPREALFGTDGDHPALFLSERRVDLQQKETDRYRGQDQRR